MNQDPGFKPFDSSITGHSGCLLELSLTQNDIPVYVKKSTRDSSYLTRLHNQAKKQIEFSELNRIPCFVTPRINKMEFGHSFGYFIMEYSHSLDFVEFFTTATKEDVHLFVQNIIQLLEQYIQMSAFQKMDRTILTDKVLDLSSRINHSPLLEPDFKAKVSYLLKQQLDMSKDYGEIPVGYCHGDLTFSNMLFKQSGGKIVLIDFLDSFIESPIQDMVKLRQDTRYYWSINRLNKDKYDEMKIKIVLEYIDAQLDSYFTRYQFYNDWYNFFQLINFSRIIPYVKEKKIMDYVKEKISKMEEELF